MLSIASPEHHEGEEDEKASGGALHRLFSGIKEFTEGMWTDFMLHPDAFDRVKARQVIFKFLAGVWPESFDANGARSDGADTHAR